MQKILIIGNGFDLHHHLPTGYNHFIDVLKTIETIDPKEEYTFNDIFVNIDSKDKANTLESYNTPNIKFSTIEILAIKKNIQENTWYQYFSNINKSEIKTWIDFEMQIGEVLNLVNIFFEKTTEFLEEHNGRENINVIYHGSSNHNGLLLNSNQFNKLVILKLIRQYEFSSTSASIIENLLKKEEVIYAIDEKKILTDLSNSLDQFIQIFNIYFTDIIEPFYKNYKQLEIIKDKEDKNMLIQPSNFNATNARQNNFSYIYSFNYTPTLKKFYGTTEMDYVHGHSGSNQNIVLGISGNDEEHKDHNMFAFTKYYQKLYKNTDYRFLEDVIESHTLARFYIWGHSLDSSDGEYIYKIVSALNKDNIKLTVFYFDNPARANQLQNLLKICGKEKIEVAMKNGSLIFQESTNENLRQMIEMSQRNNF